MFAYLLGSVPTGLVVARLMGGPDPRQAGSGNLGAANLYRLLGRNAGVFTFLGDTVKGAVPVFLAVFWLTPLGAWFWGMFFRFFSIFGAAKRWPPPSGWWRSSAPWRP